jgi:hypothetical protein
MKTGLLDFFSSLLELFNSSKPNILKEVNQNTEYVLIGDSLISELDGSQLVYWQQPLFRVGISSEFKKCSLDKNKRATPETLLACYEVGSMEGYGKNLKSLPGNWNQKCVTQHQVIEFCKKSKNLLATAYNASTIFLCKLDESKLVDENCPCDNLMILQVCSYGFGFQLIYLPLHFKNNLWQNCFHRIVIPKI